MLLTRIQRYILREMLSALMMVLGIFLLAIILVDVVEQMRTVGGDVSISLGTALQLSFMKLPMLIEKLLPFALLISAMMAFTRLNRRSELSIIRAIGVSAWRFLTPVIILALGLGLLTTTLINPLGAKLTANYESQRARLLELGGAAVSVTNNGVWLRQGDDLRQIVIHAERVEQNGLVLVNVKMLEEERLYNGNRPTNDFEFVRRIDAEKASLFDGFWQLETVIENVPGLPPTRTETLAIPTSLDAVTLLDRFASPSTIGFWELPHFISQTRSAGLDASRYVMRLQSLYATPIFFVAMALIGAIVCLRLQRLGGTPRLLAMGAGAAVGLFFIMQLSSSLGATGALPPWIAAWAPPLFVLFATLGLIAYKEDG